MLWEMLDQHIILARALDLDDWLGECPKLATLHSSMRALPELADYFAAPCYAEWSHGQAGDACLKRTQPLAIGMAPPAGHWLLRAINDGV